MKKSNKISYKYYVLRTFSNENVIRLFKNDNLRKFLDHIILNSIIKSAHITHSGLRPCDPRGGTEREFGQKKCKRIRSLANRPNKPFHQDVAAIKVKCYPQNCPAGACARDGRPIVPGHSVPGTRESTVLSHTCVYVLAFRVWISADVSSRVCVCVFIIIMAVGALLFLLCRP